MKSITAQGRHVCSPRPPPSSARPGPYPSSSSSLHSLSPTVEKHRYNKQQPKPRTFTFMAVYYKHNGLVYAVSFQSPSTIGKPFTEYGKDFFCHSGSSSFASARVCVCMCVSWEQLEEWRIMEIICRCQSPLSKHVCMSVQQ